DRSQGPGPRVRAMRRDVRHDERSQAHVLRLLPGQGPPRTFGRGVVTTATTERSGLVLGKPDRAYHSGPELSSSGARTILQSPARFDDERTHPVHKDVYDSGTGAHAVVLGSPLEVAVVPGPWTTKDAKSAGSAAREAGQVPLKPEAWEAIQAMAEKVLAHPAARALLE